MKGGINTEDKGIRYIITEEEQKQIDEAAEWWRCDNTYEHYVLYKFYFRQAHGCDPTPENVRAIIKAREEYERNKGDA